LLLSAAVEPSASEVRPEPPPEPAPSAEPAPAAALDAAPSRGLREWLWRGSRLTALRQKARAEGTSVLIFDRRARLTAELAAHTLEPAESFVDGPAYALACELYRQSIYWSLRALDARRAPGESSGRAPLAPTEPPSPSEPARPTSEELERLWERVQPAPTSLANDAPTLATARRCFSQSFIDFFELGQEEQLRVARQLQRVADALLSASRTTRDEIDSVWRRRALTIGVLLTVIAGVALGISLLGAWQEVRSDLAAGRPWRTSSVYGAIGCKSPAQVCAEGPDYFFHTAEEERPWVEIDLGSVQSIAAVRIDNRRDCCAERAVPFSVEVSTDKKQYREVLHKQDAFRSWKGEFAPVKARYVRLRASRRTLFHLSRVRVLAG
jgi:hypothetical protein